MQSTNGVTHGHENGGASRMSAEDTDPSHADLLRQAVRDSEDAKTRADLMSMTMQRVETKLDKLLGLVGEEKEDVRGEKYGTGLFGRVIRLERNVARRFRLQDRLFWVSTGVLGSASLMGGVIWWLVEQRVGFLR